MLLTIELLTPDVVVDVEDEPRLVVRALVSEVRCKVGVAIVVTVGAAKVVTAGVAKADTVAVAAGNELWLNEPLSTWAISWEVKNVACVGLILTVNSKVGTKVAVGKLKVMTNQYCVLVIKV